LGIVGFYKFAPSPDEDNYVTRYISHYFTPSGSWAATNDRHLELTTRLVNVHTYTDIATLSASALSVSHLFCALTVDGRSLGVASAFSVPVGGDPDVSGVKVRGTNEF